FNDFSLQPDETILAAVRMFEELQLTSEFNIRRLVLYKFLVTIKRNYRQVPYHNWWHAFNVTQMMFSILISPDGICGKYYSLANYLHILSSLSSEEYSIVMNALKNSILATDLSTYFG
ncbi:dual 3',5'-cyclic-AMP and -GMP phosphodiesterase 11A-like, partial [Diaphorina citri]|uniref:Dual 3',5'-cyclic-AMP and -GMP phosphodiesterase 11A-like n=1 Tax=Diaphorina citri TaxID=121845 RepID=A0A1S3DRA1_DIACI